MRIHVTDGRDADARRLDDVDDVDADAGAEVGRRHGVVRRDVGRDDDGDGKFFLSGIFDFVGDFFKNKSDGDFNFISISISIFGISISIFGISISFF